MAPITKAERLGRILDAQFRIPGTSITFGWDAILGLVPVVGDWVTLVPSLWFVGRGLAAGAPGSVIARMVGNSLLDVVVGAIPVAGDIFDVAYKSNLRNARLLDAHLASPVATRRRSRLVVGLGLAGVALLLVGVIAAGAWALWQAGQALAGR